MPRRRSRPRPQSFIGSGLSSLIGLISLLFIALTILSAAPVASASSSPPSPPVGETDTICSPTDPKDCYPKHFVPTNDFQPVREGQDMPPGLHVRMNVYTGQKEAKLYDPTEDVNDSSLYGIPADGAVLAVEPSEEGSEEVMKATVPKGAPRYEPVGKIKEPSVQDPGNLDDFTSFGTAVEKLRVAGKKVVEGQAIAEEAEEGLVKSLETLEDLAHDIYYGLQVAEDEEALKVLFCLMTCPHVGGETRAEMARQAANIVAAATQNNAAALGKIVKHWSTGRLSQYKCAAAGTPNHSTALKKSLYDQLAASEADSSPKIVKAKVAAMNGLVKDKTMKKEFLARGGMRNLLGVLVGKQGDRGWDGTRTKIGNFVLDNFLDETMGAQLGVWPPRGTVQAKEGAEGDAVQICSLGSENDDGLADSCWAHHVRKEAVRHPVGGDEHWSQEIYRRLTGDAIGRREEEGHVEL